jgi:hypothetical protein
MNRIINNFTHAPESNANWLNEGMEVGVTKELGEAAEAAEGAGFEILAGSLYTACVAGSLYTACAKWQFDRRHLLPRRKDSQNFTLPTLSFSVIPLNTASCCAAIAAWVELGRLK